MWLLKVVLAVFLLIPVAHAESGQIRLIGSIGIGSAGAESEGVVKTEDPLGLGFSAEYSMSSKFTLGVEHNRSWQVSKSNIGATGVAGRWYLWTPHAQNFKNPSDLIEETTLFQKGYIPYLGASAGFAQATLQRKTIM